MSTATAVVPEQPLVEFVRRQRWFGNKSGELAGTRDGRHRALRDTSPRVMEALVDVSLGTGTTTSTSSSSASPRASHRASDRHLR